MNNPNIEETIKGEPYFDIELFLRTGKQNAIPVSKLCGWLKLEDRALRKCIEQMRAGGIPILSCKDGYYLPADENELKQYIAKMEKTARSYYRSLRSARKALKEMQTRNQMKIPGA